jgi:energy-coupling factor transporter ATP-binding protein EcfA2
VLAGLRLKNFRGFEDHELPLRNPTIIVGRNNAGKSTIVEALRLVALVTGRFTNLTFRDPPSWLEISKRMRGVSPALSREEFDFSTAFHRYSDPPAVITAHFTNGTKTEVFIGEGTGVHAVVFGPDGVPIPDKAHARRINLPRVAILPQIGPLVHDEEELTEEYVRRTIDTPRTSQHFRNQLWFDPDAEVSFRELAAQTWPGVRILNLERVPPQLGAAGPEAKARLSLLVQNDDFVAEASRMGHGLQMWLQIMWFLARTPKEASVVLDEPDVYMHPDLQRRLLRFVIKRHLQAIVATHSAEIMADVNPENILVVERARSSSGFAASLPAVQRVIEALGGVHNLHLARLWSTKRFLLVEGDDLDVLGPLHACLYPESSTALQAIPNGDVGGWSGWERAVGAASAMRNAVGQPIIVYCLFDRDYYPQSIISKRYERARTEGINLHVWQRKEIENYLIAPSTITRVIGSRAAPGATRPSESEVEEQIDAVVGSLRDDTIAAIATAIQAEDRKTAAGTAFLEAKRSVNEAWSKRDARWALVSGKRVLAALSEWSKAQFGVSFGAVTLARSFEEAEIPLELQAVLEAIEESHPLAENA